MAGLEAYIGAAIGLLIITIVFILGPGIGSEVESAIPVNDTSAFADVSTSGADVWDTNTSIISVAILIAVVGTAIGTLYKLRNRD